MTDYKFLKGLWKGVKNFVYMGIPFLLPVLTDWLSTQAWSKLTLGAVIVIIVNWLKVKAIPKTTAAKYL